eukprot:TRINITY_DN8510_c0_g2_i2.p1 TRINITY_DN8510_c0_g2~~TRINITY_DN8510_c0_g2_i2.p1  ORF type:complete len:930 (-),score=212.48 TRINITY_DN8510_c0_g2_i2:88-2877(-)
MLLGRFDMISPCTENVWYAYVDATVKVISGSFVAFVRHIDNFEAIEHWYREADKQSKNINSMIKEANVPIIGINPESKISVWNENMACIMSMSAEEALGTDIESLVSPTALLTFKEAMMNVLATKTASGLIEISLEHHTKGKNKVCLLMNLVPKIGETGEVNVTLIGQDLTEIAELKAIEVKQKTLMAVVSHEIRSPLHGMIGSMSAMQNACKDEQMGKKLLLVKSCALRLLDLVTNVMELSESEKKQQASVPITKPTGNVHFGMIAAEVVLMTSMAVDRANKPLVHEEVELLEEVSKIDELPKVQGDPYKCTQLIYNLVTNAAKFTKKGSVVIRANHDKENKFLEVSVEDTGVGIPKASLERIFKPFEQVSGSGDARAFQGMGLGLSVCMTIVDLHEGSLRVESELGKGSKFIARLPCMDEYCQKIVAPDRMKATPSNRTIQPLQSRTSTLQSRTSENQGVKSLENRKVKSLENRKAVILSVDDDYVNQEIIQNAFQDLYEVHVAMDGQEAIKWLQKRDDEGSGMPDLILLDIQMPGMTGYEVCKLIRETFEESHLILPIVMLSAKGPATDTALEAFDFGTTDFLAKPFSQELLLQKVRVAFRIRKEVIFDDKKVLSKEESHEEAQLRVAQVHGTPSGVILGVLGAVSRRKAEVEIEVEQLTRKNKELQDNMQKIDSELQTAKSHAKENAELKQELQTAKSNARESTELKQELEKCKLELKRRKEEEETSGKSSEEISQLKAEVRQLKGKLLDSEDELRTARSHAKEIEELKRGATENLQLKAKLRDLQARVSLEEMDHQKLDDQVNGRLMEPAYPLVVQRKQPLRRSQSQEPKSHNHSLELHGLDQEERTSGSRVCSILRERLADRQVEMMELEAQLREHAKSNDEVSRWLRLQEVMSDQMKALLLQGSNTSNDKRLAESEPLRSGA